MLKSVTAQSIAAVAAAALVASLTVFFTPVAPEAKAEPQSKGAMQQPHATAGLKGDRLSSADLPARATGATCSLRSWPDYDRNCQFDLRGPVGEARIVRVIALR